MLTWDDTPTIRNAIFKRLDKEPGVRIADIKFLRGKDALRVGLWIILTDTVQILGLVDLQSWFELPKEFEHAHLLNEIDEICEQIKEARRKTGIALLVAAPTDRQKLNGTGLRGRWPN